jgi:hypothetical protein
MKLATLILSFVIFANDIHTQEAATQGREPVTLFATVLGGGCVNNPFSFAAGVSENLKPHIAVSADIQYWSTAYTSSGDNIYSVGHFREITPSIKIAYATGKEKGRGLIAGVGLGYMFAKDRGTEQHYTEDPLTRVKIFEEKINAGNWDFTSIAPSIRLGIGFRLFHFPVSYITEYYFARSKEDGWQATAGGVGLSFTFRRLK